MREAIEANYSLWYRNWFGRMFEPSWHEPELSIVRYSVACYDHPIAKTNYALQYCHVNLLTLALSGTQHAPRSGNLLLRVRDEQPVRAQLALPASVIFFIFDFVRVARLETAIGLVRPFRNM
jgi:hypothetical protein